MTSIPITIITGFLGSGKTTLILNLIPQLPKDYKLALLKNEFGDLAIDSQLASSQSISGVQELLNGCICCNLVGQLGDALATLRNDVKPNRIIIETSGSAFPATLAMEINRLAKETGWYALDGVISVIDVENWQGYEDKSYTAKLQASYTDLMVFNKWEYCDQRRFDDCLDRVGDLELDISWVKSNKGYVNKDIILGIDGGLASQLMDDGKHTAEHEHKEHDHDHKEHHQSEVEVLSVTILQMSPTKGMDLAKLEMFLQSTPKDEIYRIKSVLYASQPPTSSDGSKAAPSETLNGNENLQKYILNWAYGRWTFWPLPSSNDTQETNGDTNGEVKEPKGPVLRMTLILAKYESNKWKKRLESQDILELEGGQGKKNMKVERIL
ncbi:MAG: hypothetical protein M1834_006350 [Cirrosporium novae-zelandiae]|nr:MAG: hypothetical protein M1834_006350 [Cirrosporium novae-zelandiae]